MSGSEEFGNFVGNTAAELGLNGPAVAAAVTAALDAFLVDPVSAGTVTLGCAGIGGRRRTGRRWQPDGGAELR